MANVQVFVIDGPDGVGKSTLIKKLVDYFNANSSYKAISFSPSNSPFGKKVKQLLKDVKPQSKTQKQLQLATLTNLLEDTIDPITDELSICDKPSIVFIDRWIDSTAIYQQFAPKKDIHGFPFLLDYDKSSYTLPFYNRTFILDASDEVLDKRLFGERSTHDIYETKEFQEWVRLGYRRIFKYDVNKYTQVNVSSDDVDVNFKELLSQILVWLK